MNRFYKNMWVAVVFSWLCITSNAQQHTVTGTVKDQTQAAIPGVNVIIKGTTTGTTTDANGSFSIAASPDQILIFSFVGYATEEVPVGNQTTFSISLTEDMATLSEIVVVGYGVQKKVLNTGANLQVKGEALQKLSTTNALQALQGQAPGVQITSTSGQPGEALKVLIRGAGTINNSGPLYVVDGVLTGDIAYLNPADIESIDILKDAASAAIYGSQAANGVVLVTTKKGKEGTRAQITFDAFYGVQNLARQIDLLNSQEYATMMNEAAVNSGKLPYFSSSEIAAMGSGTDWLDQMFVNDAPTQSYTMGATGGSEHSTYSTSLSYQSQTGIVGGEDLSDYKRYNFRFNSEHKLYQNFLVLGENLSFAYIENSGIAVGNQYYNALRGAFATSPFVPMYDSEGNFWNNKDATWNNTEANPYAQMVYDNQNERNNQKLIGNLYLQVEPIENLKFRSSLGLDYNAGESHTYKPIYELSIYAFNDRSRVSQSMNKGRTVIWDNLLSYSLTLAEDHALDGMIGTSAYQYRGARLEANNADLIFDDLEHAWINNATNTEGAPIMTIKGSPDSHDNRLSYFGRVNYNYKETYLLNTTFRADASSRFAAGNRWGYFPSVSAGWVVSNASFLADANSWLDFLKLRVSWGQVGNQNVDFFQYLAPITFSNGGYIFGGEEGVLTPGAFSYRLASPNVKWETSEQTNIGFDARLFAGKLSASVDWYTKNTKDWLVRAPILATAGADAPFINGGSVKNEGVEVALSYNAQAGGLEYTVSVNGAYNKNTVGNIPTQDGIIHGSANQLYNNASEFYRAESGFPIGYFWGLQTNGIFQSEDEVTSHTTSEGEIIQPNAQPGDVRYVDRNDDGSINDLDKTIIGDPNPDFTFGFSVSLNYKGFDLNMQASGVTGNQIVQSYRNQASQYGNYTAAILDRWHGPGSSNEIPRVTENNSNWLKFSELYVQDGDFLRVNNITLGYDFKSLLQVKFVNQLRLYLSVLNAFTFTRYDGMDPEIGYGIDNGSTDRYSSGIDLGYYPRPRTMMVGLNAKF